MPDRYREIKSKHFGWPENMKIADIAAIRLPSRRGRARLDSDLRPQPPRDLQKPPGAAASQSISHGQDDLIIGTRFDPIPWSTTRVLVVEDKQEDLIQVAAITPFMLYEK
jgi:hypothetical protein